MLRLCVSITAKNVYTYHYVIPTNALNAKIMYIFTHNQSASICYDKQHDVLGTVKNGQYS